MPRQGFSDQSVYLPKQGCLLEDFLFCNLSSSLTPHYCTCLSFFCLASTTRCDDPGTPSNGRRSITNLNVGGQVEYGCNSGFSLVGDRTRTCKSDGDWTGNLPTCQRKKKSIMRFQLKNQSCKNGSVQLACCGLHRQCQCLCAVSSTLKDFHICHMYTFSLFLAYQKQNKRVSIKLSRIVGLFAHVFVKFVPGLSLGP